MSTSSQGGSPRMRIAGWSETRPTSLVSRTSPIGRTAPSCSLRSRDGAIVGSLTLELARRVNADDDPLEEHRAHIRMLGVDPAAQGRGVGTALMRSAESRARAARKSEMTLHTTQKMTAARAMYASLGYHRTEDEVFPDGFVLLGYRKVLGVDSD